MARPNPLLDPTRRPTGPDGTAYTQIICAVCGTFVAWCYPPNPPVPTVHAACRPGRYPRGTAVTIAHPIFPDTRATLTAYLGRGLYLLITRGALGRAADPTDPTYFPGADTDPEWIIVAAGPAAHTA